MSVAVALAEIPSGDRRGLCRAAVLHASALEDGEGVLLLVHEDQWNACPECTLLRTRYHWRVGEGLPGHLAVAAELLEELLCVRVGRDAENAIVHEK